MKCRWMGCTASTQKGDRKYCKAHRDISNAQAVELMSKMFRCRPQSLIVLVQEPKKKVVPAKALKSPRAMDEERDLKDREQSLINAGLDAKHGYGNGAVKSLSPEEIEKVAPSITPLEQIPDELNRRGKRRRSWQWQRKNANPKQTAKEKEA